MEVIPAVDLKGGKCVRLYRGDFDRETVFSDDPVAMALRWQGEGAGRLHIVDLDGAARGELAHISVLEQIVAAVGVPLQVGGGIRSLEAVEALLGIGVERVILGTAAVEDTALVEECCRRFGERVVVSIDAREGYVSTRGWQKSSAVRATALGQQMVGLGVRRFIYTDISRDGTLSGPNFEAVAALLSRLEVPVIAAGGISSLEHLRRLAGLGVEGAIVGRALYTGDVDLKEALSLVQTDYFGAKDEVR